MQMSLLRLTSFHVWWTDSQCMTEVPEFVALFVSLFWFSTCSNCNLFSLWLSNFHREIIEPRKVSKGLFVWRITPEQRWSWSGGMWEGRKENPERAKITFDVQTWIFFGLSFAPGFDLLGPLPYAEHHCSSLFPLSACRWRRCPFWKEVVFIPPLAFCYLLGGYISPC